MKKLYFCTGYNISKSALARLTSTLSSRNQVQFDTDISDPFSYPRSQNHIDLVYESDVTILILGSNLEFSEYVDRVIAISLKNGNGLVAFTDTIFPVDKVIIPPRLADNLYSAGGYAYWHMFPSSSESGDWIISLASRSDVRAIRNKRPLILKK